MPALPPTSKTTSTGVPSYVPEKYKDDVAKAAASTGLPPSVVAAQINYESSFNPTAHSPAGAEGIAQFLPGTFAEYGPKGGSPWNVSDAFQAYIAYMSELLKEEKGSVRKALAAYNAGPGNLSAGYGYADHILSVAKTGSNAKAGPGGGTGTAQQASDLNPLSWPSDIVNFFSGMTDALTTFLAIFKAFFNPATYIRIAAGWFGFVALLFALIFLYKESKPNGSN